MNNNKVRKKVSATSFLNRFLLTVQGEQNKTLEDVLQIFRGLHGLELADVANHITEKDYISTEHFEAYLVSQISRCQLCLRTAHCSTRHGNSHSSIAKQRQ
jgi:hypothetical protein